MNKKNKLLKNKKIIYPIIGIILLITYFIFFANGKVDLTFSAEDLKIKTIDNKNDFENIIVKNIYDKIQESCEPKNEIIYKESLRGSAGGINFGASNSIKGSMNTSDSISFEFNDILSSSIDFDGNQSEQKVTQYISFSQTNIQKQKVDEGDILKQTKDYIFYFSKNTSKIHIIKSPLDGETIDLKKVEAISTINIPSNLTIKPELFVNDNKLIYLASKKAYNNNNTIVGIYDISNLENREIELFKIFETKGDYFKSRLIDENLYLISDYSLAPFKSKFCNIINNDKTSNFGEFISFFTGIKIQNTGINKELFEELKEELESYSYKFDSNNLSSNGESQKLTDFKLFYSNKDLKEPIENLNFNIISTININNKEDNSSQVLLFGNLKNGEIHMTLDNLYLVNSYYQAEKWKCDYIDICYKEFASNNFTSISKLSYHENNLKYLKTSVVPGKPINQYSMDEDEGYFRIFTTNGSRDRDASLYVFDKKFKLIGTLENIKPNEQFKSSRFIGDKAFLVTFRQTDPLFVIDLHIPSNPKIIGELHIPGYSSYLHPYGKIGNKEYLIGIGQENNNVKIDLYEIDYDKKNIGNQIEVIQKHKYIFSGKSSHSPAENNPRTFVWDKDDKILYLPIQMGQWYSQPNTFHGLKALKIEVDSGIKEIESFNTRGNSINDSRVGYYKSSTNKAIFFIEPGFILFSGDDNETKETTFY
ncbi:MAG: beta-propeller domain-containing protein [Candidatus Gracilibacteria bacterium]